MREIRLSSSLSLEARNLALALMADAKGFLDSLFTFMDRQVQAYGADTKLSEGRRWDLVQNIVRIIFLVITKPRRACGEITVTEALTPERAPELLWATLQAHKIQKEFVKHDFRNQPEVGPMLTHFLLDVVCFQDEVKTISANASQALTESQQCKHKIDALESQYKNLQLRLPAKKGKKEGEAKNE
ncbi:hypothetical protein ACA910_016513 [Epithemia clementina (nom. ined.)]